MSAPHTITTASATSATCPAPACRPSSAASSIPYAQRTGSESFCKSLDQLSASADPQRSFHAKAVPQQEVRSASVQTCVRASVPPNDSSAELWLTFADDFSRVDYKLNIVQCRRLTRVELYYGAAGEVGVPCAPLYLLSQYPDSGGSDIANACITGTLTNDDLYGATSPQPCGAALPITIAQLFRYVRADFIYFNVLSEAQPEGLVRGQLWNPCL